MPLPPPSAALSGTFMLGGDLPVHRLGFGAMRVTGPGIWGAPADRVEAIATLRRAIDLGVTLIDTAESYGPHVSESLIATKGGLDRPGPHQWQPNGRPERLCEELEGSLGRLRLDRIDLYQLHRIDPAVPEDDQFGFLQQAQREGKIRHVGLSEAGIEQIQRAQRFFPVVSVQNKYNLADREWESVVDHCTRERIAFIPWYPLQAGKANDPAEVAQVAKRHGATPSQIALAWLLKRSPVILPIPGTSRRDHLEENVQAAGVTLSDADFAALR